MRNLLILIALAAAQISFYFWRLRPNQFEWDSIAGIALITLTVIFWSAVLQIAWRDRDELRDSTGDDTYRPASLFSPRRATIAGCFAVLAIPATIGGVLWASSQSQEASQFNHKLAMRKMFDSPLHAIALRHADLSQDLEPINLRPFSESQLPTIYTQVSTPDAVKPSPLIEKIHSGNKAQIQMLIDTGADVNELSPDSGMTPLDEALRCGDPAIIELLEQAGAKPSPDA